ncbi:MAG: hypothetical protein RL497_2957 [Pseudomonadota bacterium]|jgi:hypothetical protein
MNLNKEDATQDMRYEKKQEAYLEAKAMRQSKPLKASKVAAPDEDEPPTTGMFFDAYRAFYAIPSKISRQVWRFLKDCYAQTNTLELYRLKLKPIMVRYL